MGSVRVTDTGLQINGETEILGTLYTDMITGNEVRMHFLNLASYQNITISFQIMLQLMAGQYLHYSMVECNFCTILSTLFNALLILY